MNILKAILIISILCVMQMAFASPGVINYQGKLSNPSGQPITTPIDITFTFWNAETGGTQIGTFTDADTVTPDATGVYSTLIGDDPGNLIPSTIFAADKVWIKVHINGEDLTPRKRFTTTPYAFKADTTPWSGVTGVPAGFADGVDNSNSYTAGSGLSLFKGKFSVKFDGSGTSLTAAHANHNHWGQYWNGTGNALTAEATTITGSTSVLQGIALKGGTGLKGSVLNPNTGAFIGIPTGVSGIAAVQSAGYPACGVYGWAPFDNAIGVNGDSPTTGVKGTSLGNLGTGVHGLAKGTNSVGVRGKGQSTGVDGVGYTGVYGTSNATGGNGVVGIANGGSNAFGVYGGSNSGYAGYFGGKVQINGTLSKAGGSFKIDHPLDPDHKYLQHSFVESPDMKNIYDGVAVLDTSGKATINLPDWFQALNRDFRYQLTCVGAFAPVFVEKEIANNQFSIAGGTSGLKVSWQVTGIRKDAWAEKNRIPIESAKPAEEQGTYLFPQGFGKTESVSVEAAHAKMKQRAIQAAPKLAPEKPNAFLINN